MKQKTGSWRAIVWACLLLVAMFCPSAMAQKKGGSAKLWFVRAQALTDSIIADADALNSCDRATLLVRLGEVWWNEDPDRAKAWMKQAVDELDSAPSTGSDERRRKLFTARGLLKIIAPHDRVLSDRLANMFASNSEKASDEEREENARALLEAALAVVDNDPERAAELGIASIRSGRTYELAPLLDRLSVRDAKLSVNLFDEALALARVSSDESLFLQLRQVAFPIGSARSSRIPLELRTQLLASLSQRFLTRAAEPGKPGNCKLAWLVFPLLGPYEQLLPQQTTVLRDALGRCQASLDSVSRTRLDEALNDKPPKSVDDLLRAAEEAADPKVRDFYTERAAYMAAQQRECDRAIEILDSISSEWREFMNAGWEGSRYHFAVRAAFAHALSRDYVAMRKVIADTPSDLRSMTLLTVAGMLASIEDGTVATELAHEARRTLENAGTVESEEVEKRISLVRLFAKLVPGEAPLALQEMVEAMNRTTPLKQAKHYPFWIDLRDARLMIPANLPASLLELDELGVQQTVSSIRPPINRVRVRLGLLQSSLGTMRAARIVKRRAL